MIQETHLALLLCQNIASKIDNFQNFIEFEFSELEYIIEFNSYGFDDDNLLFNVDIISIGVFDLEGNNKKHTYNIPNIEYCISRNISRYIY